MFDVLDLYIPGKEFWNSELQEFIYTKDITLHLKHSLVSLTRWEQHYKRKFLDDILKFQNIADKNGNRYFNKRYTFV